MIAPLTLYDGNLVRYQLVRATSGEKLYNWLFLPGGPGADFSYYLSLIDDLDVPGNFWLIDFPANGNYLPNSAKADYNFDLWKEYFIPAIQRFENPILVGHFPFNYHAMLWWLKKVQEIDFNAKWIPKQVPTLIIGGSRDFIVPCTLFELDERFHRSNIQIETIDNAGHFPWFEQGLIIKAAFKAIFERIHQQA